MSKETKLLVLTADHHCMSTVGLCPPAFTKSTGDVIIPNAVQMWLWDKWQRAVEGVHKYCGSDPYSVILNGDQVDGIHHGTVELNSNDWADHIEAAVEVLSPLTKGASKTYLTKGTECHTREVDQAIGQALRAVPVPDDIRGDKTKGQKRERYAFDRLRLRVNGRILDAAHHMPGSSRPWTSSTGLGVVLAASRLASVAVREEPADIIVRSHRHTAGMQKAENGLVIVTHPWQMLTRHAHKVVGHAKSIPGIYILDWRGKSMGELPDVKEISFLPRPEPILSI